MMTDQEIFDKVKTHLLTQNKRSVTADDIPSWSPGPSCAYRSPDGLKCAIGCLIPDDAYSPDIEGFGITNERLEYTLNIALGGHPNEQTIDLLARLQSCHDRVEPNFWPQRLRYFAGVFGLEYGA